MSRAPKLRKTSFVLLALSCVPPAIGWWALGRERHAYRLIYGMAPEGVAQFAIMAIGALAALVVLLFAAVYSIRSFRALESPRSLSRILEVVLFCLPFLTLMSWAFFLIVVLQADVPQVIQVN